MATPREAAAQVATWLREPLTLDLYLSGDQVIAGETLATWNMRGRLRLVGEPHPRGMRVRQEFGGWSGELAPAMKAKHYLIHQVASFVVAETGEVLEIEGGDAARAAAEAQLARIGGEPAGSPQTWASLRSDEGIKRLLVEFWRNLTTLSTLPVRPGQTFDWMEHDGFVPPDGRISSQHRLSVTADPDCARCERREEVAEVDAAQFLAHLQRAVGSGPIGIESTRMRTRTVALMAGSFLRQVEVARMHETVMIRRATGERATQVVRSRLTYQVVR